MKLGVDVNEVVLSNVGTTGEFKIRNSAKAFKILSDGLYSNKIRAIIRELSCNAVDSHVAAGKADVPFEVHLPSTLEPWFSVRDYGLGLSGDQVVNIYTTYFESTKTDSNDFIGALGLGSKSPFSYTENFTVTAIKNGTRRIYSAFINEVGVPSIAEMSEELTDEINGVEVKFSVTDRYDYGSFQNEAAYVFKWFTLKPIILGAPNFRHQSPVYVEKNIVPGVHKLDGHEQSMAIMGNIAYPLRNISEPEKHFGDLARLLQCDVALEFAIGELDFAASREELSYVPLTISSIKKKLELLNANLVSHLAAKADAISGEWEKATFLYDQYRSVLYRAAVLTYVANTKFELFDSKSYHCRKDFKLLITDLEAKELEISGFSVNHTVYTITPGQDYNNGNYVKYFGIPVDMGVVIVLNDLKTGCNARARYHYSQAQRQRGKTVICISHKSADLAVRQAAYDKLLAELHNPPTVVKASELEKRARAKSVSVQGILRLELKENTRPGYTDSYKWVPYRDTLDDSKTYHYVCLNNHEAVDAEGNSVGINEIKGLIDGCGIPEIESIEIFGVRKSRIKEISALDNWVWFEDKLREEVAKISDKYVAKMVVANMVDAHYNLIYTDLAVANSVEPTSDYAVYAKKYRAPGKTTGNVSQLVSLCARFGKTVAVDKINLQIETDKTALCKKYPLLKYLGSAKKPEVAEYIKMIDKQ